MRIIPTFYAPSASRARHFHVPAAATFPEEGNEAGHRAFASPVERQDARTTLLLLDGARILCSGQQVVFPIP